MTDQPANEDSLPGKPADLPLPPGLAEAFGYRGAARFVAFHWSPGGDQAVYEDGRSAGTGASWAVLAYRRHPAVRPLLDEWNLGYSDVEADHCLVLDRQRNRASIAPLAETRVFLRNQHPPEPPLTEEQREQVRQRIKEMMEQQMQDRPTPAEIQRVMAEQRGRMGRMIAWLDMRLSRRSSKSGSHMTPRETLQHIVNRGRSCHQLHIMC